MSRVQHRQPQKEQIWHEAVVAWRKAGQSLRTFCAGRGLQESSFCKLTAGTGPPRSRPRQAAGAAEVSAGPRRRRPDSKVLQYVVTTLFDISDSE
jgi:hypothetical protein